VASGRLLSAYAEEQRGFVGQVVEERAGFGQEAVEPPGGASTPTGSRRFLPFLPWRLTMRAGFFTIYLSLCTDLFHTDQ